MPAVFVTRTLPPKAMELLYKARDDGLIDLDVWPDQDLPIPRDELLKRVRGKDGVLCLLTEKIDAEFLDAAGPSLKVVSTMSVGFDHISIDECKSAAVLKLGLKTSWSPLWMCGTELAGSTVGVVGLGRIGKAVAKRLAAFDIGRLLYTGRSPLPAPSESGGDASGEAAAFLSSIRPLSPEFTTLDNLLCQSDIVVVTCALTPETTNMFSTRAFALMKPSAIFINTSRGGLVDQMALYEALQSKKIAAAGLDVTTPEPLPVDHPLFTLEQCLILPHIGSATVTTREAMAGRAAENLLAVMSGKPVVYSAIK